MQRLRIGPLEDIAPGAELWLDGGHNAHAATAIAATLGSLPSRPTHLVLGMLANRDPAEFLVEEREKNVACPGIACSEIPERLSCGVVRGRRHVVIRCA